MLKTHNLYDLKIMWKYLTKFVWIPSSESTRPEMDVLSRTCLRENLKGHNHVISKKKTAISDHDGWN